MNYFCTYIFTLMLSINPKEIEIPKLHRYLLGSIGPRPIAFASTIDEHGNVNLAPFSFFNVFSANPPIMIFSPARSGRTNTTKDTYNNVKNIPVADHFRFPARRGLLPVFEACWRTSDRFACMPGHLKKCLT